jgi:hypothetical protein
MTDTIADLLDEISDREWYVYYLIDCADHRPNPWEVKLRSKRSPTAVANGEGYTLASALEMAISFIKYNATVHEPLPVYTAVGVGVGTDSVPSPLSDLRTQMLKSAPIIARRHLS